jgi:hypothetical protein
MKLKKKEFADLKQGSMSVNEYLNSFIQLSRYSPDDINTDEKKQDMFLNGLNDDVQFQLLNTDYADFQHMVNKAIVVENKMKKMEKDGKWKPPFPSQSFGSNVRPRFSQASHFSPPPTDELTASAIADAAPPESIFSATLSDIEAKCSYAATATTAESAEFAATTTQKPP